MGHTNFQFNRRSLLQAGLLAAGTVAFSPAFFRKAFADTVTVGESPYGQLQPFDSNGIALPPGFSSREIARGATQVQGSSVPYIWHNANDGQATFPTLAGNGAPDGGWILVANSEIPLPLAGTGGVSAIEFSSDGAVEEAYRVLLGTSVNCAGGPTPWGTWLSCEEHDLGMVHECDPTRLNTGAARPAMGVFSHEAACVDPIRQHVYLTEDKPNGCLYRFTPDDYPDLSAGLLEVALVDALNQVSWEEVPNPAGGLLAPTRDQVAGAARFNGGEGTWYHDGVVYFTTKGDSRVWALHVAESRLEILYDDDTAGPDAPLSGVDNITVAPNGDIFVCEDSRDHDLCLITPDFKVSRFLKLDPVMHAGPPPPFPIAGNELTGVVFNPAGDRMYFGVQRSFGTLGVDLIPAGVVYEITGPFRQAAGPPGGGGQSPYGSLSSLSRVVLRARKRRRIKKFLRNGMPLGLELDAPAGVEATLRVPAEGGSRLIGRGSPGVALTGNASVKVKPTKKAAAVLRGHDRVKATLKVEVTDGSGKRTSFNRTIELTRRAKGSEGKRGR